MLEHLLQLTSYHIAVMKNSLLFWNPLAARVNHWGPKAHLSFVRTEAKWTPSCPAAEEGRKNTPQVKITRGACKSCKDKWLLAGNKKLFRTHSSFLDHGISLQGPEKSNWEEGRRGGREGGMGRSSGRRRRGSRGRGKDNLSHSHTHTGVAWHELHDTWVRTETQVEDFSSRSHVTNVRNNYSDRCSIPAKQERQRQTWTLASVKAERLCVVSTYNNVTHIGLSLIHKLLTSSSLPR